VRPTADGLRVSVTDRDSVSAQAGLKNGDFLIGLNGTRVRTSEDIDRVMQRDFNRNTVLIEIARGRFSYSVSLPLD
jgi:type II secretory pathway component PulC